jgi:hypothetical protein
MAITGFSLAERFSRWQVLANNLKETPTATAALSDELSQLDTLLAEARALQDRQAEFRSRFREITRQLVEIAQRGDNVRSRMGAILQGKLGVHQRRAGALRVPPAAGAAPAPEAAEAARERRRDAARGGRGGEAGRPHVVRPPGVD